MPRRRWPRSRSSSCAAPSAFTWDSKAFPRVMANLDCPNGAMYPVCRATSSLSTPAASMRARREQPGFVARAEIVRALCLRAFVRPRSRSSRASTRLAGTSVVGLTRSPALRSRAEELLCVVELLPGPPRRFLAGFRVLLLMHAQLRFGRCLDGPRVHVVRDVRRARDAGGEARKQAAGGGHRGGDPLDGLGDPDGRLKKIDARGQRSDDTLFHRPRRDREQAA